MATGFIQTIAVHFDDLYDPRREASCVHDLYSLLVLALCAVLCGAEDFEAIAEYARSKRAFFESLVPLPDGTPSADTFRRVFEALEPEQFQQCFITWTAALAELSAGELVAVDGKTLRRSHDRSKGKAAIHMVSAWAGTNRLVLGQRKVDEKSNEITAIPELLQALDLAGCVVTIDAMGCQKAIAATIRAGEADYVLALKENHPVLHDELERFTGDLAAGRLPEYRVDYAEESGQEHGRRETRRCWVSEDLDWLQDKPLWQGLRSVIRIESERVTTAGTSRETRLYLSSLPADAARCAAYVRGHWGIENRLHWVLDVAFDEDRSRIRSGHGAQNFALLRHLVLNLLRRDKSVRLGVKNKRLKAAWDENYLRHLLTT